MKILILDNYDSFTYNLYQYIGEILNILKKSKTIKDFEVIVKRNDELKLEEIKALSADKIIISPGPGSPEDPAYFGICAEVIEELGKQTPLLGVCLGMQGIVYHFGGNIIKAPLPMHGKISAITHHEKNLFKGLPQDVEIMRYHSLIAETSSLPECLNITATVNDASEKTVKASTTIMAVEHKHYPIYGIQFHPESFATEAGKDILKNFLLL